MYRCLECGELNSTYNYDKHAFVCSNCGNEEVMLPKQKHCISCGTQYIMYTFFDPSGCNCCHKSFVE
jgi:hypothetical protein